MTAADAPVAVGVRERLAALARDLYLPVGIFLVTRLMQLWVLSLMLDAKGDRHPADTVMNRLLSWDGGWFVRVASEGYPAGYSYGDDGTLVGNGLAFLPGFPLLIRFFALFGLSYEASALAAALAASVAAAVLLYLLGKDLYGRRTGVALVFCFGVQPMAVVLSMGYSEGLFTAFSAGALLALRKDRWLVAGLCGAGACLTRVVGVAVVAAMGVALIGMAVRQWRAGTFDVGRWARAAIGLGLALMSLPLYWWWVDARVGDSGAWFTIQNAGWQSHWDWGHGTAVFLRSTMTTGTEWVAISTAVIILIAVALLVAAALARPWWPLLVYGAVIIAMALGTDGYYHSKVRLLLPAIVVLVPLARGLARARWATAVPLASVALLLGCWYGAYMLVQWPYAI